MPSLKELQQQRAAIEHSNEALREKVQQLQRQSEALAKQIIANSLEQHKLNQLINATNRAYYDLGTQIERLTKTKRITQYTINRKKPEQL